MINPRTLDCMYMRPSASSQGGHQLLHLPTGHVITRGRVVSLPITQNVIDLVPKMAVLDRSDDSAWTAGVDYDPQSQEEG